MNRMTLAIGVSILLGVLTLAVASAMYAGESKTFDFDFEIVNCSIINNSSNLNGLNLSWYNTNVTISTVVNYKPDNLTISCWVIKGEEVVEEHRRSGGSSCSYNKNFDWNCSEWDECLNENQTRTCKKYNNCGNTYGKPNLTQTCVVPIISQNDTEEPEPPIEPEEKENLVWLYILGGLLLLAIIFMWCRAVKKHKGKKGEEEKVK